MTVIQFPTKNKTQQKRDERAQRTADDRASMVANAIKTIVHSMGYTRISRVTLDTAIAKLDAADFILETETKD